MADIIDQRTILEKGGVSSKGKTTVNNYYDSKNGKVLGTLLVVCLGVVIGVVMFHYFRYEYDIFQSASINSLGTLKTVTFLGANLRAVNQDGATLLHIAAANTQHPDVITWLGKKGLDVNAKDNFGFTPLMRAAESNSNPDVARALLQLGANLGTKNSYVEKTPLSLAIENNAPTEVIDLFIRSEDIETQNLLRDGELRFARSGLLVDAEVPWRENSPMVRTTLFELAATMGHTRAVRYLMDNEYNINAQAADGVTTLMFAAVFSDTPEILSILLSGDLQSNEQVNVQDNLGRTPLMEAACYARPEMTNILLRAGADTDIQDNEGETALMLAMKRTYHPGYRREIVQRLAGAGANVNIRNNSGQNASDIAPTRSLMLDMMRASSLARKRQSNSDRSEQINAPEPSPSNSPFIIVDKGRDKRIGSFGYFGRTREKPDPFELAAKGTLEEIQRAIADNVNFTVPMKSGDIPLHKAASSNPDPEVIRLLAGLKLDVNARDSRDFTPLMCAARYNNSYKSIQVLLDAGADINARTKSNETAVSMAAAVNLDPQILWTLIQAMSSDVQIALSNGTESFGRVGHIVSGKHSYERTLLGCAAEAGNTGIVRFLLDRGFEIDAKSFNGRTALMSAATFSPMLDSVEALLEYGCDVDARDNVFGKTALMESVSNNPEMTKLLLRYGATPDIQDHNGNTALMWAIRSRSLVDSQLEYIQPLLSAGASIDIRNEDGQTALMIALDNPVKPEQQPGIVRALLAAGANPNIQDNEGQTALMYAMQHESPFRGELLDMLLRAGAEINIPGKTQTSPGDLTPAPGPTAVEEDSEDVPSHLWRLEPDLSDANGILLYKGDDTAVSGFQVGSTEYNPRCLVTFDLENLVPGTECWVSPRVKPEPIPEITIRRAQQQDDDDDDDEEVALIITFKAKNLELRTFRRN